METVFSFPRIALRFHDRFVLWPFGTFYYARHNGGPGAEIKVMLVDHILVGIPFMILFGLLHMATVGPNLPVNILRNA